MLRFERDLEDEAEAEVEAEEEEEETSKLKNDLLVGWLVGLFL